LPLKFARDWKFDNIWLLYSFLAYLLAPWLVAAATVPKLGEVYAEAGLLTCLLTALFGLGWGVAVVLNGMAVAMVGLSLANVLLMGSSIAIGSLLPMLLTARDHILTSDGLTILVLDLVMLVGVFLCAHAGRVRAREGSVTSTPEQSVAMRGIAICLIAGMLATCFNGALAYGEPIARAATRLGASDFSSANAIWALAVGAGSLPSLILCSLRLSQETGWKLYRNNFAFNLGLCLLMAFLWIAGTVIYGAAARMLGSLGPAIGWPVYMSGVILISGMWGWLTREWRDASSAAVRSMLAGIAVQVAAILALSRIATP
jgi:L-rhamnose-H+ transport protein